MNSELYSKLVDLYAGRELPQELEDEMEWAAFGDAKLSHDMSTLRTTVDLLRQQPAPAFTEESRQRILMNLFTRGVEIESPIQEPAHLQLGLPISG